MILKTELPWFLSHSHLNDLKLFQTFCTQRLIQSFFKPWEQVFEVLRFIFILFFLFVAFLFSSSSHILLNFFSTCKQDLSVVQCVCKEQFWDILGLQNAFGSRKKVINYSNFLTEIVNSFPLAFIMDLLWGLKLSV